MGVPFEGRELSVGKVGEVGRFIVSLWHAVIHCTGCRSVFAGVPKIGMGFANVLDVI